MVDDISGGWLGSLSMEEISVEASRLVVLCFFGLHCCGASFLFSFGFRPFWLCIVVSCIFGLLVILDLFNKSEGVLTVVLLQSNFFQKKKKRKKKCSGCRHQIFTVSMRDVV